MKKSRILSLLLAVAMLMSFVPSVVSTAASDIIYSEDFEGDAPLSSRVDVAEEGAIIEDGVAKVPSEKHLTVNSLNADVADAPCGMIHVNFDMKAPYVGVAATLAELVTNDGNKILVSYGVWGGLRPNQTSDISYANASFEGDVWYNNDFVLDFENNNMCITITKKADGTRIVDNFVYDIDLSKITTINGINFFGWAGDSYYDNVLIEYVTDYSDIPDPNVIWAEDFEGDASLASRVDSITGSAVIENGKLKAGIEEGIVVNSKNGLVADAPMGKIRVNLDMKVKNSDLAATKATLVTDSGSHTLISYGSWGVLRPHPTDGQYGSAGFDGDVWYNNDFVLDFENNKMYITVTKTSTGEKPLDNYEYDIDLSNVSAVKGIDLFGWAGDAYYDNILIEYVTEESETPDEPEFSKTIYEEDFEGSASLASRVDVAGEGATIENGTVMVPSEKNLTVNSLNAAIEDAPMGKIHVNLDMKAPNNGPTATLAELITNDGNKILVSYGVWGGLRPNQTSDMSYAGASFEGDVWYNNDFVLDFENNKMYITIAKKADGTKIVNNFIYDIDLSSVETIKGINFFGWAGTAYYDNIVIEYVTDEGEAPDEPEFNKTIWTEDFEGDASLASRVDSITGSSVIENGVLKAGVEEGIVVNSKSGLVSNAPYGKIRVNLDMKVKNSDLAATKATLVTDSGNYTLISYGSWGCLRPHPTDGQYGTAGFEGDVWYNNDFVLDFTTNKMYITVTRKDTGEKPLDNYEYALDLSSVSAVTGIDLFGWAGTAYYDNIVIEYVTDDEPFKPVVDPEIYSEDFEGDASLASRVDTLTGSPVIENGVLKAGIEQGIIVNSKNGLVANAPMGKIRVNLDMKVKNSDLAATVASVVTDKGNKTLISYGVWGGLRPHPTDGEPYNGAGFEGDVWYNNDFVLDFENNKMYITVTNKATGGKELDNFAYALDLSGVTAVKGIDLFGWAGDAYYDNILIEYVTEENENPDTPDTPINPEFSQTIWTENFEGDADLASRMDITVGSTIVNGVAQVPSEKELTVNSLNATVANAPEGMIRVNFDMKAPNNGPTATVASVVTDAGNKTLISYGVWGGLRPHQTDGEYGANFDGDVWYNNDFVLDFVENKMYITVTKKETGDKVLNNFVYETDLSKITTVKGINFFGWAGDAFYDNIVMEYVIGTPTIAEESVKIYTDDVEEYIGKVTSGANKIVIDFGARITDESLENAITLTNVTDGVNVEYEGTFERTKYVMTLGGLLANKSYKLSISGDVENVLGVKLDADYAMEFTTSNGFISTELKNPTLNGNVVSSFEALKNASATDKLTVEIDYRKTTPGTKTIKLLFGYYNGDKLVRATVKDVAFDDITSENDKISDTRTESVEIGNLSGITSVKVMLWEDFVNIKPLCKSIDL